MSAAAPGGPALVVDLSRARLLSPGDDAAGAAGVFVDPDFAAMRDLGETILEGFNALQKPKPKKILKKGCVIGVGPKIDLTMNIDLAKVDAAVHGVQAKNAAEPGGDGGEESTSSDDSMHVEVGPGSDSSEDEDIIAEMYKGKKNKAGKKAAKRKADGLPGGVEGSVNKQP